MFRPYYRNNYRQGRNSWHNELSITINNFGGGMNNVEADNVIEDNEFSDTKNMRFISGSLMEKRPGTVYVNQTLYPSLGEAITYIDEYHALDGTFAPVRCTKTKLYIGDTKVCDVNDTISGVNYVGKYYFVDGKYLRVWDGKNVYKIISEPYGKLTVALTATSTTITLDKVPEQTKVGDKVFFLSTILKDYTAKDNITKTITAINRETNVITFDSKVGYAVDNDNIIYLYEPKDTTNVSGEEVWDETNGYAYYLPCQLELADVYAGTSYIPDAPNVIVTHSNRIFLAGDNESVNHLYMSWIDNVAPQPLYYPSSASIAVTPNGQKIIDMVVFDDSLIVGRNEDMYVLYGSTVYSDDNPFYIKRMDVSTGFMNKSCGALLNNYYIFLGYDGRFYKLNTPTTYVEYLMARPCEWKIDIYSSPFNVARNSVVDTSTVAYRNEIYFNINNNITVIYNYDNMSYTYFADWKSKCFYTDGRALYIGTTDGNLIKYDDENESHTDLGNAIDCKLDTKRFDFGNSISFKYFKRFLVTAHAYDESLSDITTAIEIDYYDNPANQVINANIARFGIAEWGRTTFNNKNFVKSPYLNLDVRGRTIKFKFSNNMLNTDGTGQPMRIYDVNVLYSMRDVR